MSVSETLRVTLVGKTGSGKSSLANTIFEAQNFEVKHFTNIEATPCQSETGSVNGRSLTLVDTPGFLHPGWSEPQLKEEIERCVSESAPGPHAFLIVLKVEKFTEQESNVIKQIQDYFSADVWKYSVVVFTHGNQLPYEMKIEEFINKNRYLKDLVEKCGGRCHVVDNKYWKNNQQEEYRNNQFQVVQLLNTIERMVGENRGGCYTTAVLKNWQKQQSVLSILDVFKRFTRKTYLRIFVGVGVIVGVIIWKTWKGRATEII